MAPLVLTGETLGQRHRHFNKLVKTAVESEQATILPVNYDDPDIDNLLKIDVACSRRNVDYILNVFQSEDMLYVSRAIKQSKWLITDDQYAHIINPKYLHNDLFPKMKTKAQNKLIAAIRLNLKTESRVEEFFHFYSDDIKVAQKWLTHCPLSLVVKVFTKHIQDITIDTFKRQCENSIEVFKLIVKDRQGRYIGDKLGVSNVLISKYPEEYLDIILTLRDYEIPRFGVHATHQMMQKCPDKVIKNFEKFCNCVHIATFAKCLKKDDIKDFLLKQADNPKMKDWIQYDNVKHFIKYLSVANRFEFIKKLFIEKEVLVAPEPPVAPMMSRKYCSVKMSLVNDCASSSNAHIYRWYQFAPFEAAFTDLKKLIRVESSPAERNSILTILINCARYKPAHVHTLLQFYREKHMNEPFKFKVQFVNTLVSLVSSHKFDANTWSILNDIFSSMEVYMESENNTPYCVKAIIVYKLLHNEAIPDVIKKKYTFDTFTDYRKKLENKDKDIVFTYVYEQEMNKLNKQTTNNEYEMDIAQQLLLNVLTLLKDWKKQISDYPAVIEKIRHFIKIKKENSIKTDVSHVYRIDKKWRRYMFEESLALAPNDETCLNALRHDPGLLLRCSTEVSAMCSNDAISLKHTLSKIRIYWAQTIAEKWTENYIEALGKPTGLKATSEGICLLLPRKPFLSLFKKYTPVETKIDWSNTDPIKISLQKNIAKRMKLIRPSLNLDAILTYAKDDYLQFALPTLNSLMYNMSAKEVKEYIPILFDSPVSLKKHGLRLSYTKLKFSEIKGLVEEMWKNTKNSSIKTVLFKETFELLKKEKKDSSIQELWKLIDLFIQNLTLDENRVIYNILGNVASVPKKIKPQFFMKSYTYLKSLPAKANCDKILTSLDRDAPEIIGLLDVSFVDNVLLLSVDEFVANMSLRNDEYISDLWAKTEILASYVINSENEEMQRARYEKYLVPMLDASFRSWKTTKSSRRSVRDNCSMLLRMLIKYNRPRALNNAEIYVNILKDIDTRLRSALPIEENYDLITYWTLSRLFVESLSNYSKVPTKSDDEAPPNDADLAVKNEEKWKALCTAIAPSYGKSCVEFIKQDISSQHPSLASIVGKCLTRVIREEDVENMSRLQILQNILDIDVSVSYLVVLEGLNSLDFESDKNRLKLRRELYENIGKHPSIDIKIHYHDVMRDFAFHEEAMPYDDILRE